MAKSKEAPTSRSPIDLRLLEIQPPRPSAGRGFIYFISEKVNGEWHVCYVGQTNNPRKRRNLHLQTARAAPKQPDKRELLHRKMHARGLENFKFEVIAEADDANLDDLEQMYIEELKTHRDRKHGGYNLDKGGRHNRGAFSEETIKKMAANQVPRWLDPMSHELWSEKLKALHESRPEIARTMSDSRVAFLRAHPEFLVKHSNDLKRNYAKDPGLARRHGIRMTSLWEGEEFRRKMRRAQQESYNEHPNRASRHSDDMKTRWQDPVFRANMKASHEKRYADEAARQKTSAACQASGIVRNPSGYRGVSKYRSGWIARIKCKGKTYRSCRCSTPKEAARAYDKMAVEFFGEAAFQNKVFSPR